MFFRLVSLLSVNLRLFGYMFETVRKGSNIETAHNTANA